MAANWKHGLPELCIFFLVLEHFPREPQVLWSWQRKPRMTFWLSTSRCARTSWWIDFFFSLSFLAKGQHLLRRTPSRCHFSVSRLICLSTQQGAKGLYVYKSNLISEWLVLKFHSASQWPQMTLSICLIVRRGSLQLQVTKGLKYVSSLLFAWRNWTNAFCFEDQTG